MKVTTQDGVNSYMRESWREWFIFEFTNGQPLPKGYGLAWWRPNGHGIALPIGVNVVVAFARRLYISILAGIAPSALERMLLQQRKIADKEGYNRAIEQTQRQLEARYQMRLDGIDMKLAASAETDEPAEDAADELGNVAADGLELETWTQEERTFFAAAQELAKRKGDALFFACQDPRCKEQPVIARVDGEGGFTLACFHKRRWVPDPPKGQSGPLSRRALARLGVH
jgi:hypothetical protein